MVTQLSVPLSIRSSQNQDGPKRISWSRERYFLAEKTCPVCGINFRPAPSCQKSEGKWLAQMTCSTACARRKSAIAEGKDWEERVRSGKITKTCLWCENTFSPWINQDGRTQREKAWNKTNFCSISCSKKQNNAMTSQEAREKMRTKLIASSHSPSIRGGNGRELTVEQKAILEVLKGNWAGNVSIKTGQKKNTGLPTSCKMSVAHIGKKIAILIYRSTTKERQEQIWRKCELLESIGWRILHISKKEAAKLSSTYMSADTLLTSLMMS